MEGQGQQSQCPKTGNSEAVMDADLVSVFTQDEEIRS